MPVVKRPNWAMSTQSSTALSECGPSRARGRSAPAWRRRRTVVLARQHARVDLEVRHRGERLRAGAENCGAAPGRSVWRGTLQAPARQRGARGGSSGTRPATPRASAAKMPTRRTADQRGRRPGNRGTTARGGVELSRGRFSRASRVTSATASPPGEARRRYRSSARTRRTGQAASLASGANSKRRKCTAAVLSASLRSSSSANSRAAAVAGHLGVHGVLDAAGRASSRLRTSGSAYSISRVAFEICRRQGISGL